MVPRSSMTSTNFFEKSAASCEVRYVLEAKTINPSDIGLTG